MKSEILYAAVSGGSGTKGEEDEGGEPVELGVKMVGHGECVSIPSSYLELV